MIDYIKIENLPITQDEIRAILIDLGAKFELKIDPTTGEPKTQFLNQYKHLRSYQEKAKYFGLTFYFVSDGTVQMEGSLHCFKNEGQHNYNDFLFSEVEDVILFLKHTLKIDPTKTRLNNLEFGVNIELPFKPQDFIDSCIMFKNDRFNVWREPKKIFAECMQTEFYIKIYDKGLQHDRKENILRFELKFTTMSHLNSKGIKTLYDLIKPGAREILSNEILEKFSNILAGDIRTLNKEIIKSIDEIEFISPGQIDSFINHDFNQQPFIDEFKRLNIKNRERYIIGYNYNYWNKEHPKDSKDKDYKKKRSYYNRELKNFKNLLNRTGANQLKNEVENRIIQKIKQLCSFEKSVQNQHRKQPSNTKKIKQKKTKKSVQNQPSYYSPSLYHKSGTKNKICRVTNIDISKQKNESKFLSEKSIKEIQKTDPKLFKSLWLCFGSKRRNVPIEKQSYYIAHNIRNKYFRLQAKEKNKPEPP